VTICIETSYYALHGVKKLAQVIESIMTEYDKVLMVRALPTMYDRRPKLDRDVLQEIHNQFENLTYETVVHRTVKLREAASAGKPINTYDKTSSGYLDYARLAKEILSEETRRQEAASRTAERI
jgi:chromosome partitioning protein